MNTTKFKVEEAEYFLSMMKQTIDDESNNFIFNLNAFLSSARSITFFMQKQYDKKDGFKKWYSTKQEKMMEDPDLKFNVRARNQISHEKPIEIFRDFTLIPTSSNYETCDFSVDKLSFTENEKDIIQFSEIQLEKLNQLVNECEHLFLYEG